MIRRVISLPILSENEESKFGKEIKCLFLFLNGY